MVNIQNAETEVISKWMEMVLSTGGIEKFDDLHLDQIDERYSEPSKWLKHGLAVFYEADKISRKNDSVTLAIAFSLEADASAKTNSSTDQELSKQLDWSPPSLYLFWRGKEPWAADYLDRTVALSNVSPTVFFEVPVDAQYCCYLLRFKSQTGDEENRTVFLTRVQEQPRSEEPDF